MKTATKTATKTAMMTATALCFLLVTAPAEAQSRWSLEFQGNAAVPTSEPAVDDLGTGVGFGGEVSFHLYQHLSAYAGWDWTHFTSDESFAGSDMDFEETGYVFGLRWEHPLQGEVGRGMAGWVRAGGTAKHVEVEDDEGNLVSDSGHGLGWEAAAGLSLPLGSSWRLTPGVRYTALSHDLEVESVSTEFDLNYVALEVGVRWSF